MSLWSKGYSLFFRIITQTLVASSHISLDAVSCRVTVCSPLQEFAFASAYPALILPTGLEDGVMCPSHSPFTPGAR